jgi:hypothetical protein
VPGFDEIDRAYTRPRPPPTPGMDGYKRFVTGWTKWTWIVFTALTSCLAISVAADKGLGLGWGYGWRDFWTALGLCAFGIIVYAINRAWLTLIGFDKPARDERARPDGPA